MGRIITTKGGLNTKNEFGYFQELVLDNTLYSDWPAIYRLSHARAKNKYFDMGIDIHRIFYIVNKLA